MNFLFKKFLNNKSQYLKKMEQNSNVTIQNLVDMAHKLRLHSIEMTDASASGYLFSKPVTLPPAHR